MADENTEKPMDETPVEQTEQRTDDYGGLARRLDDALGKLDRLTDMVGALLDNAPNGNDGNDDNDDNDDDTDDIDLDTPVDELNFDL